jgi:hypothetical protein
MEETPDVGSASADGSPFIASQLMPIPAATTKKSYATSRPVVVVTEEDFGSNFETFSGMYLI